MPASEVDLRLALEDMAPMPTAAARERLLVAMGNQAAASRGAGSRWRWVAGGLAAVLLALSPPGQAVAERLGELVGIGETSSVTEANLRDPRLTAQQERTGPAIVTATGTVTGTNIPFEIVGWAARTKEPSIIGDVPAGTAMTCMGTVWPTIGRQETGKWCRQEGGGEGVPYPFHTFGVGGSGTHDYGPNAPYEFVGVTRPEVARLELTYRNADGDLEHGQMTLGVLDGDLLEETGGTLPFGFFEGFIPYDGAPRDRYGFTGSSAAESAVITAYDADGNELGSDDVGRTLKQARPDVARSDAERGAFEAAHPNFDAGEGDDER